METDPKFVKGVKNSRKYFGAGAGITAGTVATIMGGYHLLPRAAATLLSHPELIPAAGDVLQGAALEGPPPAGKYGYFGAGAKKIWDWMHDDE